MRRSVLWLSLIILVTCQPLRGEGDTLLSVIEVFRHGARAPLHLFPAQNSSLWLTEGLGQLTAVGIRAHYELGQYIRQRYDTFVPDHFNHTFVYVRSTDSERTLMSAQSQLFGLFPLGTGPTFTPNVPGYPVVDGTPDLFQPIPIHTVAKDEDSLLYAHDICPVYQDALDALETSSEWYTKEKETAVLRATIAPLVGLESVTLKLLKKIYSMWNINEVHHVEHLDGLTELKDQLKAVALWINQKKWGMGKEMGRRLGGNMIREFMQRMDDVLNLPDSPKLLLYSAHDSTIKNLLSALCVPLMKLPPFNSSVVFELWRQEATGDILVNSFLDWEVLELPLCTAPCTLTRFKEGYEEMVPSDWAAECAVQGPSSGGEPSMEWLWLVLAFVGGGSVMFLAEYMVARRRRRRRMDDSDEEMPSGRSYGSL